MKRLPRFRKIIPALLVLLAACAPPPPAAPLSEPTPRAQPQPPASTATIAPTPEPMSLGIPAVEYGIYTGTVVLASSLTGKPIDGTESIPLRDAYSYAYSPDGNALAVASLPKLHLIRVPSWQIRTVEIDLHGYLATMAYSPDGSLLALASGDPDASLTLVDAATGQVKASAQAGFAVRNLQFTADGKELMIYGPHLADSGAERNMGVSTGAPEAALLSVVDLGQLWSVRLSGLRDGTFPKPDVTDLYQPGAAWHYSPGVAFAPDTDVLYLVHGDEDRLTTVDFTRRSTRTVSVQPRLSWFEQLLDRTAGVAYAKGMDGTTKQAVISPDGALLYVVGSTEAVSKPDASNNFDLKITHVGLQVIAVKDGTLLQSLESEADMVVVAPDRKHLLVLGWQDSSNTPWTDVYDMQSMKMVEHRSGVRLLPARRADGLTVLQSSVMVSSSRCTMASVDAASWSTIASWTGFPCSDWLMDR